MFPRPSVAVTDRILAGCGHLPRATSRPAPPATRRPVLLAAILVAVALAACAGEPAGDASSETGAGSPELPIADGAGTPVLFDGAQLVLGDGGRIEPGRLVVADGRIVEVGPADAVDVPLDARVVDAAEKTIVPALIDGHAHLGYEGHGSWGAEHYHRENLADHLQRYSYYGFGAVLSAGTDPVGVALEVQRAQREEGLGGARLLFAAGIGPPGQGPNDAFLEHVRTVASRTGAPVVRGAATPEDGRRVVREVAGRGVEAIKIWVDDRGGSQQKLTPPVYRAILGEASDRGLEGFVHQQSAADVPDLVEAGADGFLHGRLGPGLDGRIAELLAEADVFLVPNLGLAELRREDVAADPFLAETLPSAVVDRLRREREGAAVPERGAAPRAEARPEGNEAASPWPPERERELREAMSRLLEAEVPIVLGTDGGAVPDHFFGYSGHRELEILVRLGMSPMEALVSATGRAADRLGLGDETGVLEPGRSADFVVLDADPLRDIRNTRRIAAVYLRGRPVDRDSLRGSWTSTTP